MYLYFVELVLGDNHHFRMTKVPLLNHSCDFLQLLCILRPLRGASEKGLIDLRLLGLVL